jgi:hypothetical protein
VDHRRTAEDFGDLGFSRRRRCRGDHGSSVGGVEFAAVGDRADARERHEGARSCETHAYLPSYHLYGLALSGERRREGSARQGLLDVTVTGDASSRPMLASQSKPPAAHSWGIVRLCT